MSGKQSITGQYVKYAVLVIYFAFISLWICFPLLIIVAAMDVFPFLQELGQRTPEQIHRDYILLVSCASVVFLSHIAFFIWHLFIKGHVKSVLKQEVIDRSKFFYCLSVICNLALLWNLLSHVFPICPGCG